ncbi:MAG: hypothetical protein HY006_03400, partial [Candidatus Sungbacteria bacterium]|nr:hypothetical protein [Candidatus Sungbacteria bacterium]
TAFTVAATTGLTTIAGSADGTDALVLTLGDILVSNGDLDLAGGDFNVVLDAADSAAISKAAASSATAPLTLANTTAASDTSGSEGLDVALTVTNYADDGAADTHTGLDVLVTSNTSDAGTDDIIYGIQVQNLGGAADGGNEYAIYQAGTTWDLGLKIEDAVDIDGSANIADTTAGSDVAMGNSTGNLTFLSDNADFTLTDATDNVFQLVNASNSRLYLDVDAGATDTVTLGNSTDVTAIAGSATSTITLGTAFTVAATTGLTTIAGSADGTDALVLTLGDILVSNGDLDLAGGDFNVILVSNGDLDLAGGDFNVTLDGGDGVNISKGAAPTVDTFTIAGGSAATDGVDALAITLTATDGTNLTNSLINGSLTAQGTASTDVSRGLFLDLAAQAGGTEKAIEIENTTAWDTDIELQNDETIVNSTDGTVAVSANSGVLIFDVNGEIQLNLNNPASSTEAVCSTVGGEGDSNTVLDDCTTSVNADYAERFPTDGSSTYGDIVVPGDEIVYQEDEFNGRRAIVQAVKSSEAYQGPVIGIVSNNYGDFTSAGNNIDDADNAMPVALVGRVPVNVTDEGGQIEVGDFITTSSSAGKGMKATEAGRVIGMALSSFDGTD